MHIPKTTVDLEALLYALTQQSEPLPEAVQRSLQEVGQALRDDHPEAAHQLRELIQHHPPLEIAYKTALEQLDKHYDSQQRTKSLSVLFQNTPDLERLLIATVMPTSDWVTSAKSFVQQPAAPTTSNFWDKADRVVVVIAGGAALGSAIAQIPGAIGGAALAAAYGWYISAAKTKSVRTP